MQNILPALSHVQKRLADAAANAGRADQTVQLIAVSKTFETPDILPVLEAGQRLFGENRVQEAQKKWPGLRKIYNGIELHLIGPLQSNKVEDAVQLFDVIQTLDRPKLATALAREIKKNNAKTLIYVQVNTGREAQKAGILPEDFEGFMRLAKAELGEHVVGLMCIPPVDEDPRPHFHMLRSMAASQHLPHLSMGMSADFEIAIAEGATHVRVGSAIFGTRPKAPIVSA
jgi:PLP dependent protein